MTTTTKTATKTVAAGIMAASTMVSATAKADPVPGTTPSGHVVQFVKFQTDRPRDELLAAAADRKPQFKAMPGLVQKYYLEMDEPNTYGGIYIWESKEAMAAFTQTDLFKTIPASYGVVTKPEVQIIPVLYPLR